MTTGPQDELAPAGRGRLRASHADREQAIELLKAAFVSRTYAELAAVTADIPAEPVAAGPVPASTPARTLARAARRSAICMLVAFALVGLVALTHSESLDAMAFFPGVAAVIAASGFLAYGMVDAWNAGTAGGWRAVSSPVAAVIRLCPELATTTTEPTCGLLAHGRAGRAVSGEMPRYRAVRGRYRAPCNRPPSPCNLARSNVCRFATSRRNADGTTGASRPPAGKPSSKDRAFSAGPSRPAAYTATPTVYDL